MAALIIVILIKSDRMTKTEMALLITVAIIAAITFGSLLLTAKRTGILFGTAAILLGTVTYRYKKIRIARFAGLGIVVLLLLLAASRFSAPLQLIINRFLELGKDTSTTNRIKMWKLALEMFARHPVIGNGWESFKYEYYLRLSTRTGGLYDYLDAHNVYLQVLAETGILGFSLFMTCIGTTFLITYRILRARDRIAGRLDKAAVLYAFMYQVYFILYCATGNCLYDITFIHYTAAAGLMYGVFLKTISCPEHSAGQAGIKYETYRYFDISQSI